MKHVKLGIEVSDGRVRILDHSTDPSRCLPRVIQRGHPLWRLTQAAVRASPDDTMGDAAGLWFRTVESAEIALAAAEAVARTYKL